MELGHCDNCKREFTPFQVDGIREPGWAFILDDNDPVVLMSDMSSAFCVATVMDPASVDAQPGREFWCVQCIMAVQGEEYHEDEIED